MNGPAFGRGTVIGMVLIGMLAFIALLYWLGNGGGTANNGGAHAGGRGLTGYAALAAMMEADGFEVRRARNKAALNGVGLLVLTPPAEAKGEDIARIVDAHRRVGPTMVITPKWSAMTIRNNPKAKRGWTEIVGTALPSWPGFEDGVSVDLGRAHGWHGGGFNGKLADGGAVLFGSGKGLVPLVTADNGRILAAWVADEGYYPALERFANVGDIGGEDTEIYPLVLVFEPDLLNNRGLADKQAGLMARDLMLAAADGRSQPITFDLTLNGLGATRNLLTLAFEPPFVAATISLFLAMLAVAWRAFNRFGPARQRAQAIAAGKTALVGNSAGLIRRAGRIHLISGPYADAARERLIAALGLPRGRPANESEAAIDRVQERRGLAGPPFSHVAARLRAARRREDVAKRAAELQKIEKELA